MHIYDTRRFKQEEPALKSRMTETNRRFVQVRVPY